MRAFTDGFRQPKRGMWALEWVNLRPLVPDAPRFNIPWKWLGIAAAFAILGALFPWEWAAVYGLPLFGMAQQALPYGLSDNDPDPANRIPNREAWKRTSEMFSDLYSSLTTITDAGAFEFSGELTDEEKIDAAIASALASGDTIVRIPFGFLPYDVTLLTNLAAFSAAGGRLVREGGDYSVYDALAYGATADGIVDDTPAVSACFRASATGPADSPGGIIFAPRGTYSLTSDFFVTIPSFRPTRIVGAGIESTIFKKGFNGTWFTFGINVGNHIRWEDVTFDGQHDAGVTGSGFVYTGQAGGAGNDYHSYFRCRFRAIESHFSIGTDAAQYLSFLDCEAYPSIAQQGVGEYVFLGPSADDTLGQARHRRMTNCNFLLGTVDISGMQDVYMATCNTKRLHTSATSAEYYIAASLLGNSDAAHPLSGVGAVVGCRFAGDVVLHSSFTGTFVGNFQTSGTFTNNTVGSNALILHHALGVSYQYVGGRAVLRTPSGDEVIATSRNFGFPDADATLTAGGSAPVIIFNNALAANRTITLSTTGAKNGDRFRIVRKGLGAFTMDVGGLKTIPSATAAFVDVEFTGSAWTLTGYGLL